MNKSTVYNHLKTLEDERLIVRDGSEYRIGLRLLKFGSYAQQEHRLYRIALPEIERLAAQTGEIASLVVEEYGQAVYLTIETGDQAIGLDLYPGSRRSLHATAGGKAIMAEFPPERVDEIDDQYGLAAVTQRSITYRDELTDRLAEIRERGIAFDDQEYIEGLRSVAAPIHATDGNVLGAVSVAGPASRLTDDRFEQELPAFVNSALNVIELDID